EFFKIPALSAKKGFYIPVIRLILLIYSKFRGCFRLARAPRRSDRPCCCEAGLMSHALECPATPGGVEPGPEAATKKRGGGRKTTRTRASEMKPGQRAQVLLPDELVRAFEAYKADLTREYEPRTVVETWLVAEMARGMARLEHCANLTVGDLQHCLDM